MSLPIPGHRRGLEKGPCHSAVGSHLSFQSACKPRTSPIRMFHRHLQKQQSDPCNTVSRRWNEDGPLPSPASCFPGRPRSLITDHGRRTEQCPRSSRGRHREPHPAPSFPAVPVPQTAKREGSGPGGLAHHPLRPPSWPAPTESRGLLARMRSGHVHMGLYLTPATRGSTPPSSAGRGPGLGFPGSGWTPREAGAAPFVPHPGRVSQSETRFSRTNRERHGVRRRTGSHILWALPALPPFLSRCGNRILDFPPLLSLNMASFPCFPRTPNH